MAHWKVPLTLVLFTQCWCHISLFIKIKTDVEIGYPIFCLYEAWLSNKSLFNEESDEVYSEFLIYIPRNFSQLVAIVPFLINMKNILKDARFLPRLWYNALNIMKYVRFNNNAQILKLHLCAKAKYEAHRLHNYNDGSFYIRKFRFVIGRTLNHWIQFQVHIYEFLDLHTTSILASLWAEANEGFSADTSHLKRPLVFQPTEWRVTFMLSDFESWNKKSWFRCSGRM